jgi:hypothetical protein
MSTGKESLIEVPVDSAKVAEIKPNRPLKVVACNTPFRARLPMDREQTSRITTGIADREFLFPVNLQAARRERPLAEVPQMPLTPVSLRYVRTAPMRVLGEATGRRYEFSGSRPAQAVDPRDLASLLSLGYFSMA